MQRNLAFRYLLMAALFLTNLTNMSLAVQPGSTSGTGIAGPGKLISQKIISPVQDDQTLSCKILATSQPWNPPGTMDVSIDGTSVGSFDFGPNGSTSLVFSCTAGRHSFTFTVDGTNISCSASFTVTTKKTDFSPMMRVAPDGNVSCGLL